MESDLLRRLRYRARSLRSQGIELVRRAKLPVCLLGLHHTGMCRCLDAGITETWTWSPALSLMCCVRLTPSTDQLLWSREQCSTQQCWRTKGWWRCKCSHIWTSSWWPVPYHQAILSSLHSAICFRGGDMAGAGPGRRMWPLWETALPLGAWRTTRRRQGRTGWKQRALAPCLRSPGQRPAWRATA